MCINVIYYNEFISGHHRSSNDDFRDVYIHPTHDFSKGVGGVIQPLITDVDCGVGNESFPSGKCLRDRVR